jgi:exodeoxyribonuclease V alpha subunit
VTSADAAAPDALAATFGRHIARWSRQQGAPDAAAAMAQRAATLVSQGTSDGHSCLAFDDLVEALNAHSDSNDVDRHVDGNGGTLTPLDAARLRSLLLESEVVGSPEAPGSLPLILDKERLYLHRYFDYECRLARSLSARSAPTAHELSPSAPVTPNVIALLDQLFSGNGLEPGTPDWQKIAAITALLGRLTIISGGPGTGKTTTVVNLLACLLEANPDCRIALTAPTGKAAARMTEVILQRAGHLSKALRARLPTESSTIHRLLGTLPNGDFRHDVANRLPIDVLVVDEASMLDLALAVHLIEAVPDNARIILLGDKDQLSAVESGAVFSELSAHPSMSAQRIDMLSRLAGVALPPVSGPPGHPATPSAASRRKATVRAAAAPQLDLFAPAAEPSTPSAASPPQSDPESATSAATSLEDCVIWLRRNYRFAAGSAIGLLATETNNGNSAAVVQRLENPPDTSLHWINDSGNVPSPESVQAIFESYAAYVEAVRHQVSEPALVTAAFSRFRVLCAVRDGPWGINAVNQQVTTQFRRTLQHPLDSNRRSEWYPGRPVMVLRNDPVLKLFNGDVGIVLPDAGGELQVYFPAENGGFRHVSPVRLPEHETAFAMTVHKSQGSEFDAILLMLPAEKNRVLTRELLYTAITRARTRLTIVANARVVASTIDAVTKRASGLLARIRRLPTLTA